MSSTPGAGSTPSDDFYERMAQSIQASAEGILSGVGDGVTPPIKLTTESLMAAILKAEEQRQVWVAEHQKRLQTLSKLYETFEFDQLSMPARHMLWVLESGPDAALFPPQTEYLLEHIARAQAIKRAGWTDCTTDDVEIVASPFVPPGEQILMRKPPPDPPKPVKLKKTGNPFLDNSGPL